MVHLSELEAMWPTSESLMKITKKATKAFFPKTMFLVQRPHSDEYKASSNINDLMETQKQIRNRHVLLINHIPFQFFCTISIGYYSSNRSEILLLNVLLTLPIFHIFFCFELEVEPWMRKYTYDKHSITVELCLICPNGCSIWSIKKKKIWVSYKEFLKSYVEGKL